MSYNIGDDGWDTWFSDNDINALQFMWGREDDDGNIKIDGLSKEYKFYQSKEKKYTIKTKIGFEAIDSIDSIIFNDKSISVKNDIIGVFNQVTDIDGITGQVYRLYNASFKRFPDAKGLNYWINKNQSGENTIKQTSKSFLASEEFLNIYGEQISNTNFIS